MSHIRITTATARATEASASRRHAPGGRWTWNASAPAGTTRSRRHPAIGCVTPLPVQRRFHDELPRKVRAGGAQRMHDRAGARSVAEIERHLMLRVLDAADPPGVQVIVSGEGKPLRGT